MCGIVGVTGTDKSVAILIDGLKRLEYRGYDSAGIYVNDQAGHDFLIKRAGRIANLEGALTPEVQGLAGIGHTRWATHGEPNQANAHPQYSADQRFYLVHNGVIENYKDLKAEYLSDVRFKSQTDTEVIVQLVDKFVTAYEMDTKAALLKVLRLISRDSSYAFALMDREQPDTLYVAKNKSPLLVGIGQGYNMVGSDAISMLKQTNEFMEIEDHELVIVKPDHVTIESFTNEEKHRDTFMVDMDPDAADKGAYPFYMLKEIDEQPAVMHKLVQEYTNEDGYQYSSDKKTVAITFDDGPSSKYNAEFLNVLEKNKAHGTFFMVGTMMQSCQKCVLDTYNSGNEVASHTYNHINMKKNSIEEVNENIKKTDDLYYKITGDHIKYVRPPYGAYNKTNLENVDYPLILWNIDPEDWRYHDAEKIVNHVMENVQDGSIILMHELYETSLEALEILLPKLYAEGYQVVSVGELAELKGKEILTGHAYRSFT